MNRAAAILVGIGISAAGDARADSYLSEVARIVRTRLDELAAAKAPKLVPPTPVAVKWKPVRLGSLDLGAPLVAMTAADLDGDGKGEMYAVTAKDTIAIGLKNNRPVELSRAPFTGERAAPAPRDPIGAIVVEGSEIVAGSSAFAKEQRLAWKGKQLANVGQVARTSEQGFLVCPGERAGAVVGRNYFVVNKQLVFGIRCAALVDREGYPLRVRAQLGIGGKLAVEVQKCPPGGGNCQNAATYEYKDIGVAFALADVDRDGMPEVIVSGASAPGDADTVKVWSIGDDKKPLYKKAFNGGVAGIVAVDGDGDGVTEVIAAVRFAGATRVDLWRLD